MPLGYSTTHIVTKEEITERLAKLEVEHPDYACREDLCDYHDEKVRLQTVLNNMARLNRTAGYEDLLSIPEPPPYVDSLPGRKRKFFHRLLRRES